jgi:hypothetical protein
MHISKNIMNFYILPTKRLKYLLIRTSFLLFLHIRINILWLIFYLKNSQKVLKICRILDAWNSEIPSFTYRYPLINSKTFLINYKYWIHWIREMDPKEKMVFNDFNPYLLINEEELLHLDLFNDDLPLVSYYFYFPDSQWKSIVIFKSIDQLKYYVSISDSTSNTLIEYINTIIQEKKLSNSKKKLNDINEGFPKIIFEGGSIRLSPEYIRELNRNK